MTFMESLRGAWKSSGSLVCVGLDPDIAKLPACLKGRENAIFEFNRAIVDATCDLVCCYKPQAAYYAGQDADGDLLMTIEYIKGKSPGTPVILDAKRGDIGATSEMYAREAFERYKADALTVNPYMGMDSLKPFLDRADKGVVILCRTSNPGAGELQELKSDGAELYKTVARLASTKWNYNSNVMLVTGATCPEELGEVRGIVGDSTPLLVPGVGAQGGDVEKVLRFGLDSSGAGLAINSSRSIIYASSGEDFAEAARKSAISLRDTIKSFIRKD